MNGTSGVGSTSGGVSDERRGVPKPGDGAAAGEVAVGWPSSGEPAGAGLGWPDLATLRDAPRPTDPPRDRAVSRETPSADEGGTPAAGGDGEVAGAWVSRETGDADAMESAAPSSGVETQDPVTQTPMTPPAAADPAPGADPASASATVSQPPESALVARAQRQGSSPLARSTDPLAAERWPRPPATRILTIANQKGGVGKTTTAVNLAAALAKGGLRVLVIDQDPQGNASTALGIDHHSEVRSIYDVLIDEATIVDVVRDCPDVPGLQCVPATIDLAGAEIELVSYVAREMRLQRALTAYLAEVGDGAPDYVIIDCPPSLGLLTINAFVAAAEVLIPIQCEYYALEGLSMLLRNIEMIRRHLNPALHVSTILLTMYDARTRLSQQVASEVREHFPEQVLRTTVPRSVRISEAPSHGQTVLTYDPMSAGSLSYLDAARELAHRAG